MLAFVVNAMTCTTGFLSNRAGLTKLTKRVQLLLDSTFSSFFFCKALAAIVAAVMSSMDSIILSSSSMFTHNIYKLAIRKRVLFSTFSSIIVTFPDNYNSSKKKHQSFQIKILRLFYISTLISFCTDVCCRLVIWK